MTTSVAKTNNTLPNQVRNSNRTNEARLLAKRFKTMSEDNAEIPLHQAFKLV